MCTHFCVRIAHFSVLQASWYELAGVGGGFSCPNSQIVLKHLEIVFKHFEIVFKHFEIVGKVSTAIGTVSGPFPWPHPGKEIEQEK